jgi:hypothetical protein
MSVGANPANFCRSPTDGDGVEVELWWNWAKGSVRRGVLSSPDS